MGLKLSFELSDRDLLYFREALRQSREAVRDAEETEIVDAVRHVLEEIREADERFAAELAQDPAHGGLLTRSIRIRRRAD